MVARQKRLKENEGPPQNMIKNMPTVNLKERKKEIKREKNYQEWRTDGKNEEAIKSFYRYQLLPRQTKAQFHTLTVATQ